MAQSGSEWLKVAQSGSEWLKVAQSGSEWIRVAQSGSEWLKVAQWSEHWTLNQEDVLAVVLKLGQFHLVHTASVQEMCTWWIYANQNEYDFCAVITKWLNSWQRNLVGVRIIRSAGVK